MIPKLELTKLTVIERLQLIGELWDSIDAQEYPALSKSQKDELDTRLVAYQQDSHKGQAWETVKTK
jgi:putative addiction module component (TIGR02574 family)